MQVESITNHDVKAIEYVIKERIAHHPELAKVSRTPGLPCYKSITACCSVVACTCLCF